MRDYRTFFICLFSVLCIVHAQVNDGARRDIGASCDILSGEANKAVCGSSPTVECMNEKAIYYTNHFRKCRGGLEALVPGTRAMLGNAIQHSNTMEERGGSLFHQVLRDVEFGSPNCKKKGLNGENVAWHTFNGEVPTNPAYECVLQWINSQGHRENMLGMSRFSKNFKTVVIGIIYNKATITSSNSGRPFETTRVMCTQTFISNLPQINSNDPQCMSSIDTGSGNSVNAAPRTKATPTPTSTSSPKPKEQPSQDTGNQNKKSYFIPTSSGRVESVLHCEPKPCRFCTVASIASGRLSCFPSSLTQRIQDYCDAQASRCSKQ